MVALNAVAKDCVVRIMVRQYVDGLMDREADVTQDRSNTL